MSGATTSGVADTGVAPDEAYTSIQYSDDADSQQVATLVGHSNLADYVADGLQVKEGEINWTDGTLNLTEGKAFWLIDEISDRESDEHAWHQCLFTSYYPPVDAISFDPTQTQHVFARCDGVALGDPIDSPKIDVSADPEPDSEDSIRIATLDPDAKTVRYHNQNPDGVFESLKADSVVIRDSLEAEGLVDTTALADKAVTEPKLDDGAVSQRAAGADSIGSDERIDESVVEGDMADDAASERVHQDDSVTKAVIAANAVVAEHIVDGTLSTGLYGNRSITGPKIDDSTISTRALKSRSVKPGIIDANKRYRMAGLDSTDSVLLRGGGNPPSNPVGSANNEVLRMSGLSSDLTWQVQGGGGRATWAWNAEFDPQTDRWHYIEPDEPAMAFRMHAGQIDFWTAGGNNTDAGDPIDWERCSVDEGGISNAHHLGGASAGSYLRKRGVVTIDGGELTLQNHDSVRRNTSHDLVFELQPSGERLHMNHRREDFRIFQEGRFANPWLTLKDGMVAPGEALQLNATNVPRPPRSTGARIVYHDGEFLGINDADRRTLLGSF